MVLSPMIAIAIITSATTGVHGFILDSSALVRVTPFTLKTIDGSYHRSLATYQSSYSSTIKSKTILNGFPEMNRNDFHNNDKQGNLKHFLQSQKAGDFDLELDLDSTPGDEAAYFDLEEQKLSDWIKFSAATAAVLGIISYIWFLPWGYHLGDEFLNFCQTLTGTTDPAITVATELIIFAIAHSGLAGLRPYAEEIVGSRAWRVLFACVSLPLALSCISYFINHAHEGIQLWNTPYNDPILHSAFWITNFISFLFLYPSTFNLLEIAAIEKPQLHLWKPSGIIRITRHPQAVGQLLWCLAHTAYLGTSTALSASTILILHHAYSVWHGDRRLQQKHGEAFERVKEVTSVIPFQAVWEGRQELPNNYWEEFARGPYLLVVGGTIAAYFAHPFMMAGAALLHW